MIFLFMNELSAFVQIKTTSEMVVDMNRSADKLKINVDITLNRLPCSILSLDVQDIMGSHDLNVHGKLKKIKLDKNGIKLGELIEEKSAANINHDHSHDMPNIEDVKKSVKNEEGCQIVGNLEVLRVPGNFHISSHAFGEIISQIAADGTYKFDISHVINHISFGDESDISYIKNNFNVGILNPVDGVSKKQGDQIKMFEYYLKVVPTSYTDIKGRSYNAHQFTANSNEVVSQMMIPTIFFRFDISPILVKVTQYKEGFFHFFIQICAIVGGMFTVMGILDNLIHRLFRIRTDKEN